MNTRPANAVLGLWLFFSTFLWRHARGQRLAGWIIGMLAVTAALAGSRRLGREVTLALGGALILIAILLAPRTPATFWNSMLVGLAMILLSVISHLRDLRGHGPAEI